jgi:hypothetical protein
LLRIQGIARFHRAFIARTLTFGVVRQRMDNSLSCCNTTL